MDGKKRVKASHTRLPSTGPRADPGVQAVSLQVTISHPTGYRLPLLSARPAVTFPAAEHRRPLAGTKLYCLVTEAYRYEQLAEGCYAAFAPSRIWTHDLSIVSPTLYPLCHSATCMWIGRHAKVLMSSELDGIPRYLLSLSGSELVIPAQAGTTHNMQPSVIWLHWVVIDMVTRHLVVSCNWTFASSHGRRHLVNAYRVKAWCGWSEQWCVC